MSHRFDIPLHRDLQSSARWHGRRVGKAIAMGDNATASYELSFARRTAQAINPMESADYWYIFDSARSAAIRGLA